MPGRRVPHIRHTGHRTPNTTDWSMKTRARALLRRSITDGGRLVR
jgi:hypothetical protein